MKTKYWYDVRQVDCYVDCENEKPMSCYDWCENTTYDFGGFETASENVGRAFRAYLKRAYGIVFVAGRTYTENDCNEVLYICDRKTHEPLFRAVVNLMGGC